MRQHSNLAFAPNRTGQPKKSLNSLVSEFRRWIKVKDCGTIRVSVRRRSSATNVVVPHSPRSFSKPSRPGRNVVSMVTCRLVSSMTREVVVFTR